MRSQKSKKFDYVLIAIILFFPFALYLFQHYIANLGLLGVFVEDIYYAPFGAWLEEPFFRPDSELGFIVLWPGRILTTIAYAIVLFSIRALDSYFFDQQRYIF